MLFFTADEHYGHYNAIKFNDRPFSSISDMDAALIANHNSVVGENDTTIHLGDFTFYKGYRADFIIERLNGKHVFVRGSHDYWMNRKKKHFDNIWEGYIDGKNVVGCHYAMRRWPRSHYGAWLVFGHSHGRLDNPGKCWDVGVDNNGYYPISFNQLSDIMANRPENEDFIPYERRGKPRKR